MAIHTYLILRVLQSFDTLATLVLIHTFPFIIILVYILRTFVDKHLNLGFTLTERFSRRHLFKKLADIDYADDLDC